MKILITGSNGQLGNEIRVISANYPQHQFFFTDVAELDICDKSAIKNFISENKIEAIINCAAYTAVDKAEDDVELCYKINRDAVKNLGETAQEFGLKIIHVSTDYVFDGTNHIPYTEEMEVKPLGVYGKSKQEGEKVLQESCADAVIVRTSWLYSSFGNNFVKTMLKLGRERDELNVIFDQIGTPTYAQDLADALLKIISSEKIIPGIYHFSNEGVCSWYDFTKSIHKIAGISCNVNPIESKDYPAKVTRPHYSVLNKAKIKRIYGIKIPHWEESLKKCVELLK
ncbi:dTDP-4-dehydrorhamnose reductase [uncultured Paludibacter sp.]|nr:dTDP-4-dehydrorhamnose reductase [uncultured Paludibacter sp.]